MEKKKEYGKFLIAALQVCLVAAFPAIFLYCRNADQADFYEIVPALLLFCGMGLFLLLCSLIVTRSSEKAVISATILTLVMTNFSFLESLLKLPFPYIKYWHAMPIILVIALHIVWLIFKFLDKDLLAEIAKVVGLVFGVLVMLNIVMSVPKIITRIEAKQELNAIDQAQQNVNVVEGENKKPNIYLLLFDEYANFPQMEEYYGYDNAPLREFLDQYNFNVSYPSQNESVNTVTIITNLVNLDYIVEDETTTDAEKEVLRKNGALYSLLKEYGYDIQTIETGDFLSDNSIGASSQKNQAGTVNGETLAYLAINKSVFYPFYTLSVADTVKDVVNLANYIASDEFVISDGNTFTMIYFLFPPQPFVVDEDGNPISVSHSVDWEDNQYYLGQYKYATKLMLPMVENIIEKDPNAVILLQSDHGARAAGADSKPSGKFTFEAMKNPLNAVYFAGEELNIEGLSSVNTLRTILNKTLGTDLAMLSVPEYP